MRRQEAVLHAAGETIGAWFSPSMLFLAAEPHLSYSLHLHGLYKSKLDPYFASFERSKLWLSLFEKFGRSSVEAPRTTTEVFDYVAKYCTKSAGYFELFSSPWAVRCKCGYCEVDGPWWCCETTVRDV